MDIKHYGQKILDGSIVPTDDELTFRALDSLFCKNKTDKEFYFNVADKIRSMADGALSEYFSGIASRYYISRNREFIEHSIYMKPRQLHDWLEHIAFEIAANEQSMDSLPLIRSRLEKLVEHCACTNEQRLRVGKYNATIYSMVEANLKDQ